MELLVNTWRTKGTPWLVKVPSTPDYYIDAIKLMTKERLENIKNLVLSLPAKVVTPKSYTELSLPRYYLIILDEDEKEIIDVIGVKLKEYCPLCPTKWSYKLGYWHPQIQILIAEALDKYLSDV